MKCQKYIDLIPLYILEELDHSNRSDLKEHLARCTTCQLECEEIKKTVSSLISMQSEELSEIEQLRLQNSIYRSILTNRTEVKKYKYPVMTYLTRTAAAILIFTSGIILASYYPFDDSNKLQTVKYTTELNIKNSSLKGYAHTSTGLKLIAKGSKALNRNR